MQIKEGELVIRLDRKKAQVWIETVIYTLIALTIIGLFLSFAKPKIEEIQDKAVIDQSLNMLEDMHDLILNIVEGGAGNKRIIDIGIKKGTLTIDGVNDQIKFELEGRYTYTEPGEEGATGSPVKIGNVIATTQQKGKTNIVTLISNYSGTYDIQYKGGDNVKAISKAPINYKVSMENMGDPLGLTVIEFDVE